MAVDIAAIPAPVTGCTTCEAKSSIAFRQCRETKTPLCTRCWALKYPSTRRLRDSLPVPIKVIRSPAPSTPTCPAISSTAPSPPMPAKPQKEEAKAVETPKKNDATNAVNGNTAVDKSRDNGVAGDTPRIMQWPTLGLDAFEDAGPADKERAHRVFQEYKEWATTNQGKSDKSMKDYMVYMGRLFDSTTKSIACFATDEFIYYGRQKDDVTGKSIVSGYALSGMKLFQIYFRDVLKESVAHLYNGVVPEVTEPRRSSKSHKKQHKRENENGMPEDGRGEAQLEAYPEVDLSQCPKLLCVASSGKVELDGDYYLEPVSSRGHPVYKKSPKEGDKKDFFLYWMDKWRIGPSVGAKKSTADVHHVAGMPVPTEPYPHPWKILFKDALGNERKNSPSMRVFLGSSSENKALSALMRLQNVASNKLGKRKLAATPDSPLKVVKLQKLEPNIPMEEDGVEAVKFEDAKSEPGDDDASSSQSSDDPGDKEDKEEDEEANDSSSDDSDSDSSSSASAGDTGLSHHVQTTVGAGAGGDAALQSKNDMESLAAGFRMKLRTAVMGLPGAMAAHKKLVAVRASLEKRVHTSGDSVEKITGVTAVEFTEFLEQLEEEFGTGRLEREMARPPPGPPPKHLHSDGDGEARPPSAPPPAHLFKGVAQPDFAPMAIQGELAAHRDPALQPRTSLLRRTDPRVARSRSRRRLSYISDANGKVFTREIPVMSHRSLGTVLWFASPGAVVLCDGCDTLVHQGRGSLTGKFGHSQFAQDQYLCHDCMRSAQGY